MARKNASPQTRYRELGRHRTCRERILSRAIVFMIAKDSIAVSGRTTGEAIGAAGPSAINPQVGYEAIEGEAVRRSGLGRRGSGRPNLAGPPARDVARMPCDG